MPTLPRLFRLLEDDWSHAGRGRDATAALARWAERHPVLDGFANPAAVVARCHSRDGRASELVAAVLTEAGDDPWAARTVLQAVLPGIAGVARRASCYVGGQRPVWQSGDELDQDVVLIALERIQALAGAEPAYPCRAVVDGTWQRVRHHAASVRQALANQVDVDAGATAVASADRSGLEELGLAVIAAVNAGTLGTLDAGLVYSCHVAGYGVAELAPATGRTARSLWRRRRRAEELLVARERADD
ncbi:MAG: hypothetical protein ACRD07_04605 [Acidimicrobiales bacterium]